MSRSHARRIASILVRLVAASLPARLRGWGAAIRAELDGIAEDREALLFAIGMLLMVPRALLSSLFQSLSPTGDVASPARLLDREMLVRAATTPHGLGFISAAIAVGCGCLAMALAGAPLRYLVINVAALAIGGGMLVMARHAPSRAGFVSDGILFAAALALLATAIFGTPVEGAARWIRVGMLFVQPSLVLLPAMVIAFAGRTTRLGAAAMVVAAGALALQPDRAVAGALVAGLALRVVMRPDRCVAAVLAASVVAFIVALARADRLPAVPHVDRVFSTAFDVHPVAGVAVLLGTAALLLPALASGARRPGQRELFAVFAAVWLGLIIAAALGNYPTPLVGYGGSAIIGYLLSIAMLPRVPDAVGSGGQAPHVPRTPAGARFDESAPKTAIA